MKKKLTPEDRERMRRVDEEGRAARESMGRILDEVAERQRQREERASRRSVWGRLTGSQRSATAEQAAADSVASARNSGRRP